MSRSRRRARPPRLHVVGGLRVRAYEVLRRAVEDGIDYGWMRAHKHTDTPSQHAIKNEILQGILNEVCEWFAFDEELGADDGRRSR